MDQPGSESQEGWKVKGQGHASSTVCHVPTCFLGQPHTRTRTCQTALFYDPFGSSYDSSHKGHVCCAAQDVEGSWELVFSTQLKSGYMPIRELVGFYPSREEATIDTNAGPLPIGG